MSRQKVTAELFKKIAEKGDKLTVGEVAVLALEDIALSLAQIADNTTIPSDWHNPSDDLDETINRIFGFDKEGE